MEEVKTSVPKRLKYVLYGRMIQKIIHKKELNELVNISLRNTVILMYRSFLDQKRLQLMMVRLR